MTTPRPEQHILRQNLKRAPYFGSSGGLLALVLGFWTPFYISYLLLAALVGGIMFMMSWIALRRRVYLGPETTLVFIFCLIVGRDFLLPHDLPHWVSSRCFLQAAGVSIFVLAALHLAFRNRIEKDLEEYADKGA